VKVLDVRGISKSFGGPPAVDRVSFGVEAGELLALIGPNGAGKTTCFNMIGGQLKPDRGRIRVLGRESAGWPPRRIFFLGVGRTFQITATFGSMTVRENVQLALAARRGPLLGLWRQFRRVCNGEAEALLARVGIGHLAKRASAVLAYGDLKRLELAMALANDPRLLLLDEPTAGMAPRERADFMDLVTRLVRSHKIGVLFTEHDMQAVFRHADRVVVLNRGQVLAQGKPDEVRANPAVQEAYLGGGGAERPA
jgi:branched-chain amino acid transport system ATP-binding protein